jgi:benzoyl-CoA reductase/2-hydroxyglutaryl-CoA dehydratase subunit BcrC/BadD/HgdB
VETLKSLSNYSRTRPETLLDSHKKGVKIVGYTGRFVPEELIYAAGAVPYLICRGGDPEAVDAVLPYMLRFMSPYARQQIGYHLLGLDPLVPVMDLIVAQCTDCHMSRLADLFEYFELPTLKLGVPSDWKKVFSYDYYFKGLLRLKKNLEKLTGNEITNEKLKKSTESMNKIRGLLRSIDQLRRKKSVIGGYSFIQLNHFSFNCDPSTFIREAESLFKELKKGRDHFEDAPRILLAGHVVAMGDYVVPRIIEECRGAVASEFLDEGLRFYQWDVKLEGDLMKNLARTYYYDRIPPSIFQPAWHERLVHLEKKTKEYNIDEVIWYQLSFEEVYNMESSIVSKRMKEINMPFLKLESSYDYSREATAPLRTRIESSIEAIRARRR